VGSLTCNIADMAESMFVIALISQKGGPGKTTLAINLAVAAAEQGLAAVIIDLDPQANAANWKDRRTAENPAVVAAPPGRVRQTLEAAAQHGADFVVIDSPGKADSAAIVAAQYADLVYIPVEAHMSNLETLPGVSALLQATPATPNKTLPAFVVINKLHPSATTQAEKVKSMIAEGFPFPVCPVHLSQFDVYATSQDSGQSVLEAEPEGRAANEIRQLYKFTVSQSHNLEGPHGHKRRKESRQSAKEHKRG
jgi:chromosome partitioning protein